MPAEAIDLKDEEAGVAAAGSVVSLAWANSRLGGQGAGIGRRHPSPGSAGYIGQRVVRFWMRCVATDPPPTLRLTPRVKVVVANAPR